MSWFNPNPTRFINNSDSGRELVLEKADIELNLIDGLKEPETFEDAYYHLNHEERMKWRDEISKEFDEMKEKGIYEMICKSESPNGRICIKNKWVLKIKRNGIFGAQLVACGCSQIQGVDFQESFDPMINDVTFCILLIMMLTWNLKGKLLISKLLFCTEISEKQSS
jgi:hypothetical protein